MVHHQLDGIASAPVILLQFIGEMALIRDRFLASEPDGGPSASMSLQFEFQVSAVEDSLAQDIEGIDEQGHRKPRSPDLAPDPAHTGEKHH